MPRCNPCGKQFSQSRHLTVHQKSCPAALRQSRDTLVYARQGLAREQPPRKRSRVSIANADESVPGPAYCTVQVSAAGAADEQPSELITHDDFSALASGHNKDLDPLRGAATRSGRQVRATWKVRDHMPEAPGVVDEAAEASTPAQDQGRTGTHPRRVRLLLTERIKTAANRFHISRLYKRRPVQEPDPSIDLHDVYTPTAAQRTATLPKRAIAAIIAPYPNLSAFLFGRHFWLNGRKKSVNDRNELQAMLSRPDFKQADVAGVNFDKIDAQLAAVDVDASWVREGEGWKHASVTINVPSGIKSTQQSRRAATAEQRRLERTEGLANIPPEVPGDGDPVSVPDLWHKDLCAEIKNTIENDAAAKRFVFDPYTSGICG